MPATARLSQRANNLHASPIREILSAIDKPGMISFAGGLPSPESLPALDLGRVPPQWLTDRRINPATGRSPEDETAHRHAQAFAQLRKTGLVSIPVASSLGEPQVLGVLLTVYCLTKEPFDDMAKTGKQTAPARKGETQDFGDGEYILPVWHRCQHVFLDPIAAGEHALLVAARTKLARPARERQQIIVAARRTVNARKTVVRVAAFENALDHPRFQQPLKLALLAERRSAKPCLAPQEPVATNDILCAFDELTEMRP